MTAILFGSISTLADTSEIQREAFNRAFSEHGLDWRWDRDTYLRMLETSGGEKRIADYAESVGANVDAAAVHRSKSEFFRASLTESGVAARPGVVETVGAARSDGAKVGLVTTTSPDNLSSLFEALSPDLSAADFDVVVDVDAVADPKPDPAAYSYALDRLGESARDCVAIEDNRGGVDAAVASGVACVAFPNANTESHDFDKAVRRVSSLDFAELVALAPNG